MKVIAVPNPEFPPADDALAGAQAVLDSIGELGADTIRALG